MVGEVQGRERQDLSRHTVQEQSGVAGHARRDGGKRTPGGTRHGVELRTPPPPAARRASCRLGAIASRSWRRQRNRSAKSSAEAKSHPRLQLSLHPRDIRLRGREGFWPTSALGEGRRLVTYRRSRKVKPDSRKDSSPKLSTRNRRRSRQSSSATDCRPRVMGKLAGSPWRPRKLSAIGCAAAEVRRRSLTT